MAKKTTKKDALAPVKKGGLTLTSCTRSFSEAVKGLVLFMSGRALAPAEQGHVLMLVRDTKKALEDTEKLIKAQMVALLKEKGEQVTDKGSRALEVDGLRLKMKPYRTGYDPKKLEALLRARSMNVESFMRPTISYAVDDAKIPALAEQLGADTLESTKYDESWVLEAPEAVDG